MFDKVRATFSPKRIKRIGRATLFGILIGIISGLGAIVFTFLLQTGSKFFMEDLTGFILPGETRHHLLFNVPLGRWVLLVIPSLGGIVSGLIVFNLAPEAEGHGTDAMIDTFHRKRGLVRRRVPFVKTIASAITIGSGGSAGKEGPIAQIGAGFGSFFADLLKLSDRGRLSVDSVGYRRKARDWPYAFPYLCQDCGHIIYHQLRRKWRRVCPFTIHRFNAWRMVG